MNLRSDSYESKDRLEELMEEAAAQGEHMDDESCLRYAAGALNRELKEALERSNVPHGELTHDMLKALAGDPVILAASDEEELRRRYRAMRERCGGTEVEAERHAFLLDGVATTLRYQNFLEAESQVRKAAAFLRGSTPATPCPELKYDVESDDLHHPEDRHS